MDVTVYIKKEDRPNDCGFEGDLVSVVRYRAPTAPYANSAHYRIDVMGVPEMYGSVELSLHMIQELINNMLLDPLDIENKPLRKHLWSVDIFSLSPRDRDTLIADGRIELAWNKARNAIRRRFHNPGDPTNSALDTFQTIDVTDL